MKPLYTDDAVAVCLLVEMGHPEGTIYAATCLDTIEWNGQEWIGVGLVSDIQGLDESAKVEVREVTFTLAGVTEDLIAGLSSSVKGYQATVRHALLDDTNRVVGTPQIVDVVELDTQDYKVGADGSASITITGHSVIVDLRKSADTYYTPELQREKFPGDTGLDRIPALVDRVASWTPS